MNLRTDVVVVGGGPAGLFTAHRLAERGFGVRVLDGRRGIGEQVICTGVVSREAFERYGFSSESVRGRIQHLRLVSPGGIELRYSHPTVLACAVDRHAFDNEIRTRAEHSGAVVTTGARVRELRVEPDGVRLRGECARGPLDLTASLCVLATGIYYSLHRAAGLHAPASFLKAAQAHLPVCGGEATTVYVGRQVAPGGFAWIVPLDGGLARVGLMTHGDARCCFRRLLEQLALPPINGRAPLELKPIAQGMPRRSSAERVLVVGEAAGQVKTTTGGGIYFGLLGAEIAAEVAAQALARRDLSARALAAYDCLWKQRLGREIKLGHRARLAASALSNAQLDRLVRAARENGLLAYAERNARFDWHRKMIGYVLKLPAFREALLSATEGWPSHLLAEAGLRR